MTTRRGLFGLAGGAAAMAVLPPTKIAVGPVADVISINYRGIPIYALGLSMALGGMAQIMEPHP